jgi:hypothetical protein
MVEAIARDPASVPLAGKTRALVDYALKLTRTPEAVGEPDLRPLRE